MKNELLKKLYETYKYSQTHEFENEVEKIWTDEAIYNLLDSITKEELEEEIIYISKYKEYLNKELFYRYEYDPEEQIEGVAFTPNEIYRLWIEKDMCIYDVLSGLTDEYIEEVIKYWVASNYDYMGIQMLMHYIDKKKEFRGDE